MPRAKDEALSKAKKITKILSDHKAEDIKVIDVKDLTPFTEYYVIATAPNERALGSYAEVLEDELEALGENIRTKEGKPNTGWTIVDSGNVVIHIFLEEVRATIGLEALLEQNIEK